MIRLLWRFVLQCIVSGIATARIVLSRVPPTAGVARMTFGPMSDAGAAVLGAMVTLTPGSTVIDIDPRRREMLLHLLDITTAEVAIAAIRRDFEADIARLFPERPP